MAKSNRVVSVDMNGVNSRQLVAEGDHEAMVDEITIESSDNGEYLKWVFKVVGGENDGAKLYHNTSLQKQALWNLKNVLTALGVPVPNSVMKLNLADVEGRRCGVTVTHATWQGKKQAKITDLFPSEAGGDAEEGEEEAVEEEAAEEETVDLESMSLPELVAHAKSIGASLTGVDVKKRTAVMAAIQAASES